MGNVAADLRTDWQRRLARERPPYGPILAVYTAIVLVLTATVTIAARPIDFPWIQNGPAWLDSWFQFDSGWYYSIAADGYTFHPGEPSSIAFFPTYPMAVRALGWLIGDYQIAGTLLSVSAGAAAICLFASWVWHRLSRRGAVTAIALMMLYPYAFYFYGAMYSDPVFLLVVIASFILLERRRYWAAGLVGVLATAGRPVGIAVTVGLVLRMLEMLVESRAVLQSPVVNHAHPTLRQSIAAIPMVRFRQAGVLISVLGLVGWCAYLWVEFGRPLAWIEAQAAWGQASGPDTWFKVTYFDTLLHGYRLKALSLTAQLVMCLLAVALLPRVRHAFGWGYCAYAAVVLAIPLIGTKDFYGTGRYVMVAFPVIAVAGALIADNRRRWLAPIVLGVFAFGLIGAACLYAMGLPVS